MKNKYIRTKDGVYEVNSYIEQNGKIVQIQSIKYIDKNDKTTTISMKNFYKEEIIRQADTIEELCDRVVAVKKDGDYKTILRKTFEFEDKNRPYYNCSLKCESGWIDDCKQWVKEYDLYFAIWTDKGLIYVAKMNSKGELELI